MFATLRPLGIWILIVGCLASSPLLAAGGGRILPEGSKNRGAWCVDGVDDAKGLVLAADDAVASLCVDASEAAVVQKALGLFAADVERVTGCRPGLRHELQATSATAVIVGTLGQSRIIQSLVDAGKVAPGSIEGVWEAYQLSVVDHPAPGIERALVVVGSDKRGTAYGLMALSEAIGVSPWWWWADATPMKRERLVVHLPSTVNDGPRVRYRGFFINDERFGGFALWAAEKMDPATANVGPNTYARVFELMLRLRANTLWPAMHPGTRAFNSYPENASLADDYGIVMGSSHCEIMLRDNEYEWTKAGTYGEYNYKTNRSTMIRYWDERLAANGRFENLYTIGLRGVHDTPMEGADTLEERVKLTQLAIDDQRQLLNNRASAGGAPQLFCAYKEVLAIYRGGLQLPDDVTLMWADDNHGFIRNLSDEREQQRQGGSGIYYHLSYHGDPESWLWLSSLSPVLIAEEMGKALEFGADRVWIFNVGDIKPAEKELSFAMEMAWDPVRWNLKTAKSHLAVFAERIFGPEIGARAAKLQEAFYRLCASGKPEHVWLLDFSASERERRLAEWDRLARLAKELSLEVPLDLRDAYFQLYEYPIVGAALMNELDLLSRRSLLNAVQGKDQQALQDGARSRALVSSLDKLTETYNAEIAGGKWHSFMKWKPWQRPDSLNYDRAPVATPEVLHRIASGPMARTLALETAEVVPPMIRNEKGLSKKEAANGTAVARFHWVSEKAGATVLWFRTLTPGIDNHYDPAHNTFWRVRVNEGESREASIRPLGNNWHPRQVGPQWSRIGEVEVRAGENVLEIEAMLPGAFIEAIQLGGAPPSLDEALMVVPASAADLRVKDAPGRLAWIPGLGASEGALVVEPRTIKPGAEGEGKASPEAVFKLQIPLGARELEFRMLPTQRLHGGRGNRMAVSVNGAPPVIWDLQSEEFSSEWQQAVLHGYTRRRLDCRREAGQQAEVAVYFLDPNVVLEEVRVY